MKSGIYKITSPSGNCYIGSSSNIERRWYVHKKLLLDKNKNHHSKALQFAHNKYNGQLNYEILEIIDSKNIDKKELKNLLFTKEQYFIDLIKPKYNQCPVAGSVLGRKHDNKSKSNIKNSLIAWNKENPEAAKKQKENSAIARRKSIIRKEAMANTFGKSIICVEENLIFRTQTIAANWLREKGILKAQSSHIGLSIKNNKKAYGYKWARPI